MNNNESKLSMQENIKVLKERDQDKIAKQKVKEKKLKDRYKFIIAELLFNTFPDIFDFNLNQTNEEREAIVKKFERSINLYSGNICTILKPDKSNDIFVPVIGKRTYIPQ